MKKTHQSVKSVIKTIIIWSGCNFQQCSLSLRVRDFDNGPPARAFIRKTVIRRVVFGTGDPSSTTILSPFSNVTQCKRHGRNVCYEPLRNLHGTEYNIMRFSDPITLERWKRLSTQFRTYHNRYHIVGSDVCFCF